MSKIFGSILVHLSLPDEFDGIAVIEWQILEQHKSTATTSDYYKIVHVEAGMFDIEFG